VHILVIGAGVSGLSSALRLLEKGHSVEIWAREAPRHTTSAVAAAIWYPYLAAPADRVLRWGAVTLRELVRLAEDPETGVVLRDGIEVFREPAPVPWWASAVPGFRRAAAHELPAGYVDGHAMRLPVADMSIYLGWLERRVLSAGATLIERTVADLGEAAGAADAVVNTAGLGARELAKDPLLRGIRGQIQIVTAPSVSTFLIDDATTTYIIPRLSNVVLGGSADESIEDASIDSGTAASIRGRCIELVPGLASAKTMADRVGIRPYRPAVRLELERMNGTPVVHNYGHGGAGVTLSWGCAEEVNSLL
jgi:D-amino-acid oxidase